MTKVDECENKMVAADKAMMAARDEAERIETSRASFRNSDEWHQALMGAKEEMIATMTATTAAIRDYNEALRAENEATA